MTITEYRSSYSSYISNLYISTLFKKDDIQCINFPKFRAFVNVTSCHLPAAAIIAGIGNTLNALHAAPKIAMFFTTVGTTILEQLGILFAIV